MSYTQIEFLGKTRGVKFNNYAIEQMAKVMVADSVSSLSYATLWGGLLGNCYVKREEPDFTFEQVVDGIDNDENAVKIIEAVAAALNESTAWKRAVEAGEEAEKKKVGEQPVTIISDSPVVS